MTHLTTGAQAPDIDLPANGDNRITLTQFRGKPIVLFFYPRDNTPGCTKEAISFTELKPQFEKYGVEIIGISPDTPEKHDKFVAKHNLNLMLGADTEHDVASRYGVWVEKSMYGKKYMGVERSTFLIDCEGKIAHIWSKVKVPGHAEDVLKAVNALQAG